MPYLIVLSLLIILAVILNINMLRYKKPKVATVSDTHSRNFDEEKAVDRFSQMIRCKTVSNKNSELVDESEFEKFRSLLPSLYPTVFDKCECENIAGGLLIKMSGKSSACPSVLMAHFDVVSVNREAWEVDPFAAVIKNGCLWGRGTLDTKCTLFAILESSEILLKENFIPENDIYFSFGCNEEIAGNCAVSIVQRLKDKGVHPAFVLDEGGTILSGKTFNISHNVAAIAIAEKGPMDVEFTVKGESGHSSKPPKHTAVGILAKDVSKMENRQFPMKMNTAVKTMYHNLAPYSGYFRRLAYSNLWLFSHLIMALSKNKKEKAAMFRTSIAFTQFKGSKGANVLPEEAKAVANIRLAQGQTPEDAVKYLLESSKDKNLKARIVNVSPATPCAETKGKYWDILNNAVTANFKNTIAVPYLMLGGTDSRFYSDIADNIYKFAPLVTSDELLKTLHSENERIPLDNIMPLVSFFADVMERL